MSSLRDLVERNDSEMFQTAITAEIEYRRTVFLSVENSMWKEEFNKFLLHDGITRFSNATETRTQANSTICDNALLLLWEIHLLSNRLLVSDVDGILVCHRTVPIVWLANKQPGPTALFLHIDMEQVCHRMKQMEEGQLLSRVATGLGIVGGILFVMGFVGLCQRK